MVEEGMVVVVLVVVGMVSWVGEKMVGWVGEVKGMAMVGEEGGKQKEQFHHQPSKPEAKHIHHCYNHTNSFPCCSKYHHHSQHTNLMKNANT